MHARPSSSPTRGIFMLRVDPCNKGSKVELLLGSFISLSTLHLLLILWADSPGFNRGEAQLQPGLGFAEEWVPGEGDITAMSRLQPYLISSSALWPEAGSMEKKKQPALQAHKGAWIGNVTQFVPSSLALWAEIQIVSCILSWATSGKMQVAAGWASTCVGSASSKFVPCFHAYCSLGWRAGIWRGCICTKHVCFPKYCAKTTQFLSPRGLVMSWAIVFSCWAWELLKGSSGEQIRWSLQIWGLDTSYCFRSWVVLAEQGAKPKI